MRWKWNRVLHTWTRVSACAVVFVVCQDCGITWRSEELWGTGGSRPGWSSSSLMVFVRGLSASGSATGSPQGCRRARSAWWHKTLNPTTCCGNRDAAWTTDGTRRTSTCIGATELLNRWDSDFSVNTLIKLYSLIWNQTNSVMIVLF